MKRVRAQGKPFTDNSLDFEKNELDSILDEFMGK